MKQSPARRPASVARGVTIPAVALAMTASVVLPAPDTDQASATPEVLSLGSQPTDAASSSAVTLITGDVVHWQEDAEGDGTALVEDKGVESVFQTIKSEDGYYVIPSEVQPLVGTFLDRELFNVSSLVEQGYTDDAVNGVPVILQREDTRQLRRAGSATTAPGLDVERALPSISAVAGTLDRDAAEAFGEALARTADHVSTEAQATPARSTAALAADSPGVGSLSGVEKIWLDSQMTVSLEESVPQTGAPQAWEAGFDGTGMTIAVLDTGIDQNHPDVAGKIAAAKNFTDESSVQDGHGHGTHVATTAAGTGAASDGLRKGVAPGADLVIGKVMNNEGDGATSGIIAGMEWAASLDGVDVINMSLGGGFTDGTDPMSLALNELTAEHGVLFVTSAGNDGPGSETLTTPATADAALTVGAVDSDGQVAYFSSRGPRLGDHAIKPEITAPGVSITAGRASGTSMGTPVDDFYTSTSGTSMAAPHVAGAVALLKQQHPDWAPEMLKAGLVNSAAPNSSASVFEQGGGELDLVQAIETTLLTTPATLSMGLFEYPHDDAQPVSKTLTYTNHGEAAVTFEVQADLADEAGAAAPEGMLTVEPSTVDLAPGASTEVTVTLDPSLGGEGVFSGELTATDADGNRVTGTPVGFNKEPELYDITIEGIQRNGQPAADGSQVAVVDAVNVSDFRRSSASFVDGVATIQVPPGTYSVMSMISTVAQDANTYTSQAMMGDPQIEVTADTHLTFDAREAVEVTTDTPYDDIEVDSHGIQYLRSGAESGGLGQAWMGGDWPYYVSPTEEVTLGEFKFGTKFDLSGPGVALNLAYPEVGAIPADVSYEVNETNTATVDTSYYSDAPDRTYYRAVPARLPWESIAPALYHPVAAPSERVEVFSANETLFGQVVLASIPFGGRLEEPATGFEPGAELEQSWFAAPRTPSLDEGNEYTASESPTSRLGNNLNLAIYEFGDSNSGEAVHFGSLNPFGDTEGAEFRLYQDGELYAEGPRAFGTVPVAPESRLRFELDVHRETDWWTTSTQTHTAWEFDSATTQTEEPLPLLQVDYDIDLDLRNTTLHPSQTKGPFTIGLDLRMPYGVPDTEIEDVTFWMSYDDGATWTERPVRSTGGNSFEVIGDHRGGGGHASLKIEATDAEGNTVEQEVIRAYALRP